MLWLFVINLGIAFGAGLYEHRIVVPDWIGTAADGAVHWNADAAKRDDTGLRFWAFVTAGLAAFADRVVTFGYFIPTMIGLMTMADSPEAVATAMQWAALNYLRHALVLVAWLAGMKALTMSDRQPFRLR